MFLVENCLSVPWLWISQLWFVLRVPNWELRSAKWFRVDFINFIFVHHFTLYLLKEILLSPGAALSLQVREFIYLVLSDTMFSMDYAMTPLLILHNASFRGWFLRVTESGSSVFKYGSYFGIPPLHLSNRWTPTPSSIIKYTFFMSHYDVIYYTHVIVRITVGN